MYTRLGEVSLKSGETMEVGVVAAPDPEWQAQLLTFLGHKPGAWFHQIAMSLAGQSDGLHADYYIGLRDGLIISQVMIAGDHRAGVLGHVITLPDERRKGASRGIMQFLMPRCIELGYRVITLGTTFDCPAYHLYTSFGFASIAPGSGQMVWQAGEHDWDDVFSGTPDRVRAMQWNDWPYVHLLGWLPIGEDLPRSPAMGLKADGTLEMLFLALQERRDKDSRIQAQALVTSAGATAGWAILAPDTRWFGDVFLIDTFTHPSFTGTFDMLLSSLDWPDIPTVAYVTDPTGIKAQALAEYGFRMHTTLPRFIDFNGRRDLALLIRP